MPTTIFALFHDLQSAGGWYQFIIYLYLVISGQYEKHIKICPGTALQLSFYDDSLYPDKNVPMKHILKDYVYPHIYCKTSMTNAGSWKARGKFTEITITDQNVSKFLVRQKKQLKISFTVSWLSELR